jgi:hypothetical protein
MNAARGHSMTVLWLLLLPFSIWGAHFLAAYVVTAIFCAKSIDAAAAIVTVRWIVSALTFGALAALGAALGYARGRFRAGARAHPGGGSDGTQGSLCTSRGRRPFVQVFQALRCAKPAIATAIPGFTRLDPGKPARKSARPDLCRGSLGEARFVWAVLLMMSALSALAVIYVAGVVFFFGNCQ